MVLHRKGCILESDIPRYCNSVMLNYTGVHMNLGLLVQLPRWEVFVNIVIYMRILLVLFSQPLILSACILQEIRDIFYNVLQIKRKSVYL
jgi:hypothetical protein